MHLLPLPGRRDETRKGLPVPRSHTPAVRSHHHGPREISHAEIAEDLPRETPLRIHARTEGGPENGREEAGEDERTVLLRPEAPRVPSPLRLPPRAPRRAALVGRAKRAIVEPGGQTPCDAHRGPSVRLRRVRRRHSIGL